MTAEASAGDGARAETCPECGAAAWKELFTSRGFPIARCARCDLVRTLGVDDSEITYPTFDQRDTLVVRALRAIAGVLLAERRSFVRRVKARGRLLDFGCGNGGFARVMARAGYEVVGVEPFSLGRATDEPGLRLLNAPLEKCRGELEAFDVITLWQVLEHVRDPRAVLAALLEHLRPGGVIVVSVPNFASWQSRFFGPSWFHLDPPRHVTHFDADTLAQLFEGLGLEVGESRAFHWEYGPVGWLQSLLNRILPHPNFLFEFVKDRGALSAVSVPRQAFFLSASAALAAVLLVPSIVAEAFAARRGAGAVITCALRPSRVA